MSTSFSFKPIVTDGLVLYLDAANTKSYTGTGTTWYDLTKNGNNGVLTSGPVYNSENGGNITFDGVDDYVNLGNPNSLDILNFTICTWAKSTSFSDYQNIIFKGSLTGQYGINLESSGRWSIQPNNTFPGWFINDYLELNTWYFFCGTYDGTKITAYRDGVQKAQYSSPQSNYGSVVTVGADIYNNRYFNGKISSVQIYNRPLTSSEILQNYNSTKSRFI